MAESERPFAEQYPLLIKHLNKGDCVLFVGDALDTAGPQSQRLAATLIDEAGAHVKCVHAACQTQCQYPQACTVPLARAAQLYESRFQRPALLEHAQRFIDKEYPAWPVAPLFRALAAVRLPVIVTTLLDDRLEAALDHAGRPYLSVVKDQHVPLHDSERVQVIRLHGSISRPESLILTEDDHATLFTRLPQVTTILQAHFASKTLLFFGYRLSESHFLALFRRVTDEVARMQRLAYALQWPADEWARRRWHGRIELIDSLPLPFLEQLLASVRIEKVARRRAELPPEPYKFLEYYTARDAAIFFGRDLEADLLQSRLLVHALTVFYGRSGTGKTSLLLARILPALEAQAYQTAYARMLSDPTNEIKAAVRGVPVAQLAPADRSRRLVDVLADGLPPVGRLVIVLDQFEEFFVRQGAAVRRDFAQELALCLAPGPDDPALDVRFVLSLRDDYLGALDELSPFLPQDIFAYRYRLENLTSEKALLAILKPAEEFGLPVEEALSARLVADLEDHGLEPANLQIVLYTLYRDALEKDLWSLQTRAGVGLTLARYDALGGTPQILADYLDNVLAELERPQHAQAILKSMVTADRTKAAVSGQEVQRSSLLARLALAAEEIDALLTFLRERRVVRKFGDEDRYELAHEVMVAKVWAWVSDDELHLLDIRDMLRRDMSSYEKFGHLLTPDKLALIDPRRDELALTPGELELLFRSALAAGTEVAYWFGRAQAAGVDVAALAREGLQSDSFRSRGAAVAALGELGELVDAFAEELIGMLADDYPQVRVAAIHALEHLRPDCGWHGYLRYECFVPAGPFIMGDDRGKYDDEKPAHEVQVDAFYICKYPVTNAEYKRYMDDIGRAFEVPRGKEAHPVVNVRWYDARDYALWAGMRLLTEAEWEKAATWVASAGRKRVYPWGDAFDAGKCNTEEAGQGTTTPVDFYSPQGNSPYGVADMAGNVWEWTSSLFRKYPYDADDGREDPGDTGSRVLRAGSRWSDRSAARGVYRRRSTPDFDNVGYGLRCGVVSRLFARPLLDAGS